MFGIPYTKPHWIDAEIAKAAARDPFGHRLHILFALFWLILVPGPVSVVQFAGIGLLVVGVLRAYIIHRTWRSFGCHPMLWLLAAWTAWQALSLSWSLDPGHGRMELAQNRWVYVMWMTWSVLQHRPILIATLALGFLGANIAQVVHGVGLAFGIHSIPFHTNPDRISGWWQPVVAGSMLTAALGLHLPAAAMGSGRQRWFGLAGSAVTLAGVLATGSRGAWLASAALIAIVLAVAARRSLRNRRSAARLGILILVLAGALGGVWLAAGGAISRRFENGRQEVLHTLNSGDYTSFTGQRILMARWAWEEFRTHPFRGVGAGGYRAWVDAHRTKSDPQQAVHVHAHNTPLHIAATTGLMGLALATFVVVFGLYGAFKGLGDRIGTYAAGPGFALLGLVLVGMTDVVNVNAQTSALLCVLLGLCMRPRPAATVWPEMGRESWGRPFPR